MQTVGKPAVNVECLGVVGDRPDSCLFERHGVLLELLKEGLRKAGRLQKQGTLACHGRVLHKHRGVDDVLVHEAGATTLLDMEGQTASREALRLLSDILEAFSADWDPETSKPGMKASSKLNVARIGPESLRLQVE